MGEIVRVDGDHGWALPAKTGWAGAQIAGRAAAARWWVGWVEHDGSTSAFVLSIDMLNGQAHATGACRWVGPYWPRLDCRYRLSP